jgi:hypothetical protein
MPLADVQGPVVGLLQELGQADLGGGHAHVFEGDLREIPGRAVGLAQTAGHAVGHEADQGAHAGRRRGELEAKARSVAARHDGRA